MNNSCRGMRSLAVIAFVHLLVWPSLILAEGVLTITKHEHQESDPTIWGRSTITTSAEARYDGDPGADLGRDASLGTGVKESNGTWNYYNSGYSSTKRFKIQSAGQIATCPTTCGGKETIDVCLVGSIPTRFDRKTEVAIIRGCASCYNYEAKKETYHSSSKCAPPCFPSQCDAASDGGSPYCCGTPLRCSECSSDSQCQAKYGSANEQGQWQCKSCKCIRLSSPLVIHLPDYFSTGGGNQSWWREVFCPSRAPRVCLDWSGDGNVTCTGWIAPDSEVAFVVALSADDELQLSDGLYVTAEPWRHFFGNVTMGPEGDFPFAHGFEALAAHCGGEHEATLEIDLTECGSSLQVWSDDNGDGDMNPGELLAFRDLGVQSLGDLRETGRRDACGNTFPYESHATCSGRPGKCGTWLDVFFEPR